MWDWELVKSGVGPCRYDILAQYGNEDFRYTHAVSYWSSGEDYCLHNHAMYELVYCVSGTAVYLADGVRYQVAPRSLLIINPTVPHKLFLDADKPFERHILYIYQAGNTSDLARLLAKGQPPVDGKPMGSAYYENADSLSTDFDRMSAVTRSPDESIRELTPYFVRALAAGLVMLQRERDPSLYSVELTRKIDSILLYLSHHFTSELSLQSIADRFFLSKDYCNRLFHKSTGMTVMYYVKYSRVLYARQLLSDGCSATDAARKSGFTDYSSFYRAYRQITGRIPSDDYQVAEDAMQGGAPS